MYTQVTCPSCGAPNLQGKLLCGTCGKALAPPVAQPPMAPADQPPHQALGVGGQPTAGTPAPGQPFNPPQQQSYNRPYAQGTGTGTGTGIQQFDWQTYKTRYLANPEAWFATALFLFFFFPWLSIGGFITISGAQLPEIGRGFAQVTSAFSPNTAPSSEALLLNLVYLVPLLSIATIVMAVTGRDIKVIAQVTGGVTLAVFTVLILRTGLDLFKWLGLGAYLSILGGLGIILVARGLIKMRGIQPQP